MSSFIRLSSSAPRPTGFLQSIWRIVLLAVGVVVGGFLLISTAAFALIVILALLVIGAGVFIYFWVRARFFGKPFGGEAFAQMRAQAQVQAEQAQAFAKDGLYTQPVSDDEDGDILDAHRTADGWTVDK